MISLYKADTSENALQKLDEVLKSGQLAQGPVVQAFEEKLAHFLGHDQLVTSSDESSAIVLALYIAGVRPGDEVLATPMACLATNMPILNLFAKVVWCDLDPDTGNLDPKDIANKVTDKTKAIVYAPWCGNVPDIGLLKQEAKKYNLKLIEDASEAIGAEYQGNKLGNHTADFTVFSFYPNKLITTGEGAAITFANPEDHEKAKWLRRYGIHSPSFRDELGEISKTSDIPVAGFNAYLNSISAAIGLDSVERVTEKFEKHYQNGRYLDEQLSNIEDIRLLKRVEHTRSAYWTYTFRAKDRDKLLRHLRSKDIHASKVHLRNDYYSSFGPKASHLPGTDRFEQEYISIPSGWWVSQDQLTYMVEQIQAFYRQEVA